MATIKVHQDICNFKKKVFGFTIQQGIALIAYAATALLFYGLVCTWALGLPWMVALPVAMVAAFPVAVMGFIELNGISAKDAVLQYMALAKRGDVLVAEAEQHEIERSVIDRVWAKKASKRASECEQ